MHSVATSGTMIVGKRHLILASGSTTRCAMLEAAGIAFDAIPAEVDEPALRSAFTQQHPAATALNVAEMLSAAKAHAIGLSHPESLVIGSDQVLDIDGELLSKPGDDTGVRATLQKLSGKTHALHSAASLAIGGKLVWTAGDSARLTMRSLSPAFIDSYVARVGEAVRSSVGAYHIEGFGVQLFDRIDGDHFTILGMPLLPLLKQLRAQGVLAA